MSSDTLITFIPTVTNFGTPSIPMNISEKGTCESMEWKPNAGTNYPNKLAGGFPALPPEL
jgi:hypothetical protein